jgi:ribonuclease VapC
MRSLATTPTAFRPSAVVLDTSALLAVLLGEPERDRFVALLADAEDPLISAATLAEASIVMLVKVGDDGVANLDELLSAAAVRCVAVDEAQARLARDAFARFGRGRGTARLNYGDCFAYALARAAKRPLLFKGDDFGRTDVTPALV